MFARTVLAITALALVGHSHAAVAIDPGNDFIPTYTGPQGGDLDVTSAEVMLDTSTNTLSFRATLNAAVGTTTGAFYVFGLDRGAGTARFGAIATGVLFDMVVLLRPDGSGQVNNLTGGGSVVLAPGSVLISGSTISTISLALSLFPTAGLSAANYTWNVWPRVSTVVGNAAISDFAPDNLNAGVTVVPTPGALGLLGLAALAGLRRRR